MVLVMESPTRKPSRCFYKSHNSVLLTHGASVEFKSEGDVGAKGLGFDEHLCDTFRIEVVPHNCVRIIVTLKCLERKTVRADIN